MRRVLVLVAARLVVAAAGLALVAACGMAASDAYHDMRGYERALHCAPHLPGDQRECIATVTVTVVERSRRVEDDSPPTPIQVPTPPPAPQPPMPVLRLIPVAAHALPAAGDVPAVAVRAAVADRFRYDVTVRTPDGRRRTFQVGKGLYDRARPGTSGYAEMWRGHVTRLTVGSESKRIPLFREFFFYWLVAWAGAVLVLGALFHPIGQMSVHVLVGGYVVGAVVFYLLRDWSPALLGVPAVVSVLVAVWWATDRLLDRKARRAW
ncbi:hypothetical protein [Actinomadura rugatobispora]|uniref:DUF2207 domain-containing protein n=1 Tax=Actinomadura rugatobispora TaxID=1994 RepID=A0ABW0ZR15_9ACTN|nr:hypothetical protein GCM10010200_022940 [Actinomadura rugatobispora]